MVNFRIVTVASKQVLALAYEEPVPDPAIIALLTATFGDDFSLDAVSDTALDLIRSLYVCHKINTPAGGACIAIPLHGHAIETAPTGSGDMDKLTAMAETIVRTHDRASTSFVQRHMGIPYAQAAAIMARLEQQGVVSPPDPMGRRHVL